MANGIALLPLTGAVSDVETALTISDCAVALPRAAFAHNAADDDGEVAATGDNGVHGAEEGEVDDDVMLFVGCCSPPPTFGAKPVTELFVVAVGASRLGVGGAVRDVPGSDIDASFIKDFAELFISTNVIGKMPTR